MHAYIKWQHCTGMEEGKGARQFVATPVFGKVPAGVEPFGREAAVVIQCLVGASR